MRFDSVLLKLAGLVMIQQFIAVFKNNITRYLIKTFFTSGELPLARWYTIEFIQALNTSKVLSLCLIAVFTLVTFPLGMWIASFKVGQSYPVIRMIQSGLNLITFPVNLFIMNKIIKEMPINNSTVSGAILIQVSQVIVVAGAYLLYRGAGQ